MATSQTPSSKNPSPKNPKSADPKVDQLLREASAALKLGDKVSARSRLQEVVALDQYNEQAWMALASVVETTDERRVCLGNVVVINPSNERAKVMLDQLSGNPNAGLIMGSPELEDTPRPPIKVNRRTIFLLLGIVVAAALLLFVFSRLSGPAATPPLPTIKVLATEAAVTATPLASMEANAVGTQGSTQEVGLSVSATITMAPSMEGTRPPTATPTLPPVPPTLPPSWTPVSQVTAVSLATLPPPPTTLTGRLVAIQGNFLLSSNGLPLVIMDASGQNVKQVTRGDIGDYGILSPDGLRLIYSRYLQSTSSRQLRISFANGTQPTELSTLWGNTPALANVQMPSLSRNGSVLVFAALNLTDADPNLNLFMVPAKVLPPFGNPGNSSGAATSTPKKGAPTLTPTVEGAPLTTIKRLTQKDTGINSWPAVSPDGTKVVYVNDQSPLNSPTTSLEMLTISGGSPVNLTDDQPDDAVAAPDWSPDGKQIAYQLEKKGTKTNDIYLVDVATHTKTVLVTNFGDSVRPHWSPDGSYIAFSSNRGGSWDIYVINVQTKDTYQVTQSNGTSTSTICTAWSAK